VLSLFLVMLRFGSIWYLICNVLVVRRNFWVLGLVLGVR